MLLLNNLPIKYFTFPGGELQVKLPPVVITERVVLTWKPTTSDHVMLLGLTVNALRKEGIYDIDLDILYLPYARQDRVCSPGEANSLEVICDFLDKLDVSTIRLWDPHNQEVTNELLPHNYVWTWDAHDIFARYNILKSFDLYDLVICSPDDGARGRVDKLVEHFDLQKPVYLEKNRNPDNGHIIGMHFDPHNRSVNGYNVMVVDDICDGGATFLMAADTLKSHGAEELYLYVTHGIFSKGLDELSKWYKHIYCHHVLDDNRWSNDNRLTILRGFSHVSQPTICY
jgi:ribose-phosphate pyrophosphokinase